MALRNFSNDFPFSERTKAVWYVLVNWEKREMKDYFEVSDKVDLVGELNKIKELGIQKQYKLLGFWQGMYSTDGFDVDINEAYVALKYHFINNNK